MHRHSYMLERTLYTYTYMKGSLYIVFIYVEEDRSYIYIYESFPPTSSLMGIEGNRLLFLLFFLLISGLDCQVELVCYGR